jgi:hypothetical protein
MLVGKTKSTLEPKKIKLFQGYHDTGDERRKQGGFTANVQGRIWTAVEQFVLHTDGE